MTLPVLAPRSTVPVPTPAQITALVDSHERYTAPLRKRMEDDWKLLILTPFNAGAGYQEYTSNEPQTYFNQMVAVLSSALVQIQLPAEKAKRKKRELESAKERFLVGILKANDERLARLGEPPLLDSLTGFVLLRGWFCGRVLLVKDSTDGEDYADITPWDPMHVSWGMGAKGLKWICHKTKKTRSEIFAEYGVRIGSDQSVVQGVNGEGSDQYFSDQQLDDSDGVDIYDWWDEENNIVVVGNEYVKKPTLHGNRKGVPAFFGTVGPLPLIQSHTLMGQDNLVHQGESIFAPNRRLYEKLNLVLSTMLQLVALSRDQAYVYTSRDGTKTLDKNPALTGAVTPLGEGEKLEILGLFEMAKDTGVFLGLLSGEIQRGALPYSVYGQLAFQLSGYAVNLLKQATDAPMMPRKKAIENALWQITNLIADQFASGAYEPMQLRGWTQNRDWFDEQFTPDMMRGLPSAEVTLTVVTPQDDMQNLQMARLASEGPWPLLPMREVQDRYLGVQDTDSMDDAVKEQQAERLLPEAALWTLMVAAENQGRPELAAFYYAQLIKQGIMMAPRPWMVGANGQSSGAANGFSPDTLSAPEQGAPNPQPTPQAGPNVPPQSPRPGAVGQS